MPLIQIHLIEGKSPEYIEAVRDGIHSALMTSWNIPEHDRFQLVTEYKKDHFHIDKTVFGVKRSDDVIVIYITSRPRTEDQKKMLYKELVKELDKRANVRSEDIFVTIVTVGLEDWSFANGIAQATDPTQKP